MSKVIRVSVEMVVDDNYDVQEIINEMDYNFKHDGIIETEIEDYEVVEGDTVYGY
jgi:hypothetical protein